MVSTIAAVGLPIDETLEIRKNRIFPENPGENMKRISIVTGIHGDELEGQYVCYELQRRIEENRECLKGIVDIYPAMNPLGMDSITRGIPSFDLDLNRMFPGDIDGSMMEYVVARSLTSMPAIFISRRFPRYASTSCTRKNWFQWQRNPMWISSGCTGQTQCWNPLLRTA